MVKLESSIDFMSVIISSQFDGRWLVDLVHQYEPLKTYTNSCSSYGRQHQNMRYFGLKMKMKDSVCVNVDRYQLTAWLLCNEADNQANIRLCEFFCVLHSW